MNWYKLVEYTPHLLIGLFGLVVACYCIAEGMLGFVHWVRERKNKRVIQRRGDKR